MKQFLSALIAAVVVLSASACLAIDVTVNGQMLPADPPAVERGGSVLLPVRTVFTALGADVTWDAATMTAIAVRRGATVRMTINSQTAYVNDQPVTLSVPAQLINDRSYVPVRFPAEAFGAQVAWNGAARLVTITLPETGGTPSGGGTPQGAPVVLTPKDGDKVGTRIDLTIRTTPGVEQVIWTMVKDANTGELVPNGMVPGIRHLPQADGTYSGGIATPRISFGEEGIPLKYEIHFRNGPNQGDPETVVTVYPKN